MCTPPAATDPDPHDGHRPNVSSEWYWEQDEQHRYTAIHVPAAEGWIDERAYLGRARWDLPGCRALSEGWDRHRTRLEARLPFIGFEHVVCPADGAPPRYLASSGEPRFDPGGRFIGYRGVTRDISAEVAERARREDAEALLGLAATLGKFGAWSSDLATGITTWSQELEGIHQCPWKGQCTNAEVLALYAPESRELLADAFMACSLQGTPFDLELQVEAPDGERTWVRLIGVAMRDTAGRIARVQGAYQDVHRSKLESERHKALAERFRTTLDSLSDGFAILDREWRVAYANQIAASMLGLTLEGALGRCYWDLFPEARDSRFGENFFAAMERREARRFEDFYAPLSMWFRISVFPCEEGIAISFTDTTAARREHETLKEMNQELERRVRLRTQELEAANRDLKAFSYSIAHDLRSPLGRIAGYAQVLEESDEQQLGERSAHYLRRIRAAVDEMDGMTAGLLSLFQVARAEIRIAALDLADIARECMASLLAGTPGRQAEVRIAPSLPARADAALIGIALQNLLGNAWKYSSRQQRTVIEMGGCGGAGEMRYFVRDNGVGFEGELAARLFEPFSRLHGASFPGYGIGLATVHKIVTRHGGRVWAESSPGCGTTLWFTLGAGRPAA